MTELIRTSRDGCFELRSNSWGQFLHPAPDPLSNAELEANALESFELADGIAPIPAELWSRWVQLCFHYAKQRQGNTEVSCRLLRHEDDKSQWRILIPVQAVDGASVRVNSFDQAIDIASGEVIAEYPPTGWVPCGSSHSHNTMKLDRFSGTDDQYELGDPGLHIVISHIDHEKNIYKPTASITANKRRFYLPEASAVIDLAAADVTFHPDALKAVTFGVSRAWPSVFGIKPQAASSIFFDPNAGNGYDTSKGRSGKHQRDLLDAGDWGWTFNQSQASFDGPVDAAETIREILSDAINDCLNCGDDQGIDHLMASLRELLEETESILIDTSDDPSHSGNSSVAPHPITTAELSASEW
jgi:hypothetical protein